MKHTQGGLYVKWKEEHGEWQEEIISLDRVTRVTAGGRQLRFRAVVVVGNKKGKVGFGTGKSWEVLEAISKAVYRAKKNVVEVPIENGTVPYDIQVKFKAAKVYVHPASNGTGIIAGGSIRKVLSLAWYSDVIAKRYGSSNRINNARAILKALRSFKKT